MIAMRFLRIYLNAFYGFNFQINSLKHNFNISVASLVIVAGYGLFRSFSSLFKQDKIPTVILEISAANFICKFFGSHNLYQLSDA